MTVISEILCTNENEDVFKVIIIELKKNPELLKKLLKEKNNHGRTPFMLAFSYGKMDAVQILNETLLELNLTL